MIPLLFYVTVDICYDNDKAQSITARMGGYLFVTL